MKDNCSGEEDLSMKRSCETCEFSGTREDRVDIAALRLSAEDVEEKSYEELAQLGEKVLICYGLPHSGNWVTDPRFGDKRIGRVELGLLNRVLADWMPCGLYQPKKRRAWDRLEESVASPDGRKAPVLALKGVVLRPGDGIKLKMPGDGFAPVRIVDPSIGSARGRLFCPGCDSDNGIDIELCVGLEARWVCSAKESA